MTRSLLAGWLAATMLFAVPVLAEEEEKEAGPLSGKVAFGYLATSGNTESESINFDTEVKYDVNKWHHMFTGKAIGKSEDKDTTAEAYKAAFETKYDLTERTYLFGLLDYNKDRFSSYEQQMFEIAGIGRRVILPPPHELNTQIGIGASQNDLVDGTSEDEFTTRLSADYRWQISETASFKQLLAVNISSSNTYTESVSELRVAIVGNLGLALSYTIKNNSDVVPGTDKTDTWTAIALDYVF